MLLLDHGDKVREALHLWLVLLDTHDGGRHRHVEVRRVVVGVGGHLLGLVVGWLEGRPVGVNVMEAMISAALSRTPEHLGADDFLDVIDRLGVEPRILYPNGYRRINRFAFVIHPLSTPGAIVHVAATTDRDLPDMDMVVTATSGAGKRILDIMKVKPGCVITDVTRPLDIPAEDVARRPDVLVIESGEIQLPGPVKMKDIGLPKGIAYACLAETIVLALEARFENFTLGRNIEWEKVREIYKLGLKHGMQLAAVSGVNGVFTEEDFERVRALAAEATEPA